jgi:hypothetical protein
MARIPMSLAWNFPIFMRNAGVEAAIRPSVYHFMSNPKPWQGVFPPWRADANEPYREIVRRYPALAAHSPRMSAGRRLRYHVQQRYKKIGEVVTWGLSHRRRRILRYEAGIALAGPG